MLSGVGRKLYIVVHWDEDCAGELYELGEAPHRALQELEASGASWALVEEEDLWAYKCVLALKRSGFKIEGYLGVFE